MNQALAGIAATCWGVFPGTFDSESGGPSNELSCVENAKMMIRKNATLMALIEAPASEYTMKLLLSLIYEKVNSFD